MLTVYKSRIQVCSNVGIISPTCNERDSNQIIVLLTFAFKSVSGVAFNARAMIRSLLVSASGFFMAVIATNSTFVYI